MPLLDSMRAEIKSLTCPPMLTMTPNASVAIAVASNASSENSLDVPRCASIVACDGAESVQANTAGPDRLVKVTADPVPAMLKKSFDLYRSNWNIYLAGCRL